MMTTVMAIILLSSFTNKNSNEYIGVYAVSASNPSQIKLTINSDNTFHYQDFSVSENKIDVNGQWKLKGKKVILTSNNKNIQFHNVWTFTENGKVAKSRKGLCYYRICKIEGK